MSGRGGWQALSPPPKPGPAPHSPPAASSSPPWPARRGPGCGVHGGGTQIGGYSCFSSPKRSPDAPQIPPGLEGASPSRERGWQAGTGPGGEVARGERDPPQPGCPPPGCAERRGLQRGGPRCREPSGQYLCAMHFGRTLRSGEGSGGKNRIKEDVKPHHAAHGPPHPIPFPPPPPSQKRCSSVGHGQAATVPPSAQWGHRGDTGVSAAWPRARGAHLSAICGMM